MTSWYQRYFSADYWVYASAEYTAERTAAEVAYLGRVLASAPGRRVLDVGCGHGRHAHGLASAGFQVLGVDVSASAVTSAAAAGSAATFVSFDALGAWPPVGTFDAVVCVQAFGWGSDEQQLRMLRSIRSVLAPGGVLVLDHSNVAAILRRYLPRSVAEVDGLTFEFLRRYDQLTGRSGGVLRVTRPDGTVAEAVDDVRLYQPYEVAALLRSAGFAVERVDAEFIEGSPVELDSRYVQFVARVPDAAGSALDGHRAPMPSGAVDLRWAPDEAGFAANVAFAASIEANATFAAHLGERVRRYDLADPYAADRAAPVLSAHLGVPLTPSQVTAGAGATGLLRSLAGLAAGGSVLVSPDGHPELALAALALGATVHHAAVTPDAVLTLRPAVVVLDRPGVDGVVPSRTSVSTLADATAAAGGTLVVDETCAAYLPPGESVAGRVGAVVLRSMSKGLCHGGLRVGFAVAHPALAERVRAVCAPLAVAALSIDLALDLLARGDVLAGLRELVTRRKPEFADLLKRAGADVVAGDPRLPWVTVDACPDGLAGKALPGSDRFRLSVPLSDERWQEVRDVLAGGR